MTITSYTNYSFNQPLLSLQVAKCELQLAFWTQLAPFLAPDSAPPLAIE